jgi:hypothetical protein
MECILRVGRARATRACSRRRRIFVLVHLSVTVRPKSTENIFLCIRGISDMRCQFWIKQKNKEIEKRKHRRIGLAVFLFLTRRSSFFLFVLNAHIKLRNENKKDRQHTHTHTHWAAGAARPQTTSAYVGRPARLIDGFSEFEAREIKARSANSSRTTLYDGDRRTIRSRHDNKASLSTLNETTNGHEDDADGQCASTLAKRCK